MAMWNDYEKIARRLDRIANAFERIANALETANIIEADRKTEPQKHDWHDDCNTCRWHDGACTIPCCDYEPKTEPQTDLLVTEYPQDGEVNLIGRGKTEAVVMAYDVYKELTEPQTDCSWK